MVPTIEIKQPISFLVTVMLPEGLTAFVFVTPERDFGDYERVFGKILDSVDFNNR
jgi:hypothetical protein